jgi:CRP/FNR family cyclic AMP-dependent transcriptional regulator
MLFLGEQPITLDSLLHQVSQNGKSLSEQLPAADHVVTLPPHQRLATSSNRQYFYLVRTGILYAEIEQRVAYALQAGDIAGLPPQTEPFQTDYFGEDAVVLEAYDWQRIQQHLPENAAVFASWNAYLLSLVGLFSTAFGLIVKDRHRPQAGFLRFKPGDIIIQKDDEADYVYTMMKGSARVEIDAIEVGLVREREIFGATAALTGSRRNASVVAADYCTVMAVPKEQFAGMIQAHPETCLHLMESMARTIDDLNARLLSQAGTYEKN